MLQRKFIFCLIIFILIMFLFNNCKKSNKDTTLYTIGDVKYDSARDIIKTKNGYILTGMTTASDIGGIDGICIFFNKNLKKIKQLTYGGKEDDKFYSIIDNINDYFLIGSTTSYGSGNSDIYVINIDNKGKLLFSKTFGGNLFDEGKSICKTFDNNFILIGNTLSFGNKNNFDLYIVKVDAKGNCLWTKTIGGTGNDLCSKIIQGNNNDYFIVGSSNSNLKGKGFLSAYLLKIDNEGNKITEKYYGKNNSYNAYNIIKSRKENFYYIIGDSADIDNLTDIYIIKIDSNGNIIWEKKYGGKGIDTANCIIETDNYELIIGGITSSKGKGMTDIIVIKLDENGRIKWESIFGGRKDEYCGNIIKSHHYYYLITGWTASYGKGDYDIILLNIDEDGKWR